MAVNQVVMPGFAAFRLGVESDGPPVDTMIATSWGKRDTPEEDTGPVEAEATPRVRDAAQQEVIVEIEETS